MKDVELLFEQAVKEVTENWRKCIQHDIREEEEKMWDLDKVINQTIDPLIIISRGEDVLGVFLLLPIVIEPFTWRFCDLHGDFILLTPLGICIYNELLLLDTLKK